MARNDVLELVAIVLFVAGFIGWFVALHRVSPDVTWLLLSGTVMLAGSFLARHANRGSE